jgi:hypothetical protein
MQKVVPSTSVTVPAAPMLGDPPYAHACVNRQSPPDTSTWLEICCTLCSAWREMVVDRQAAASDLPRTQKREDAYSRASARASQTNSRDYSLIRRITKQAPRSRLLSHFRTDVHVTDTDPDFFIERWL